MQIGNKSKAPRILFYDDTTVFGGHELMAADYILASAESGHDVHVMFNGNCSRFRQRLDEINDTVTIGIIPTKNSSQTPQGLRTLISPLRAMCLARKFSELKIDLVVILQGNIEWCTLGMIAAKLAGIKVVSYIPMAHSMKKLGARWGRIRDFVNTLYYRLPDKFVTISEMQKKLIVDNGRDPEEVDVVYNYLLWNNSPPCSREVARGRLRIPQDTIVIGLIGRTNFHQKRQDFLVKAIAKNRHQFVGYHFLIAGDGPDQSQLEDIVRQNELGDIVTLCPWSNDASLIYPALNALVIPSAYEGVPLVMLEAASMGLPVFATNVDGMTEFLPEQWLFGIEDVNLLISLLLDCTSGNNQSLANHIKDNFLRRFDKKASRNKFIESILISLK
jgi:glycosyltransferase involved in cell wall biosynthesis